MVLFHRYHYQTQCQKNIPFYLMEHRLPPNYLLAAGKSFMVYTKLDHFLPGGTYRLEII